MTPPNLADDYARLSADYRREMDKTTQLRKYIVELRQQLDDAHAVIAAQSEVLVRLQHPKPKRCDPGGFGHVNEAAGPVF